MNSPFKQDFIARYSALTDWESFSRSLLYPARKSIRVNTLKTTPHELAKRLELEWVLDKIPWCPEGYWMRDRYGVRDDLGNIPGHNIGHFFVQEAASMIPAIVLNPKPGEKILDMCASPGGKTTQIAAYMNNTGSITAADVRDDRVAILKRNIERMGATNCTITKKPGQQFKDVKFDRILVDAPCSATGTMRGSLEAIAQWNPEVSKRISFEQKSLLHHAYCVLRRGGVMVYSTCSLEPEEDEAVVDWLLKRHKKTELEDIVLNGLEGGVPLLEYDGVVFDSRVGRCLRLWPQDNDTDGFFVAKIRKT